MKTSSNLPGQIVRYRAQASGSDAAASSSGASQPNMHNLAQTARKLSWYATESQAYAALSVLLHNNKLSIKDHFKLITDPALRSALIEIFGETLHPDLIKFLAKYPELHDALLKRLDNALSIEALQVMLKNTPASDVEKRTEISKKIQDINMEKLMKML